MNSMEPTALVVLNALTAEAVFSPGGVDAILEKIAVAARSVPSDISTPSGRATIKSVAYKVARSKTALDEMGKDLAAEWKKKAGAIDAERRTIRDRLDALQEEVRKPLTDWENLEKSRVSAHETQIAAIEQLAVLHAPETPLAEIDRRISLLPEYRARDWQEFAQRASIAIEGAAALLDSSRALTVTREAERAELERLRQERLERERREHEERIAAVAAENARKAAEEKAKAEADAVARRAREEQERIEREKQAAEQAARDADARAKKAEADRIAAEQKARADAEKAARDAAKRQEEALAAQRKHVADAARAEQAEAAKREADKKHRGAVNRAACDALVAGGLTDETARLAITLIAQKAIPNVSIQY